VLRIIAELDNAVGNRKWRRYMALNELGVPPKAVADPTAFEIARVWVAAGGQQVSLKHYQWPDPAAWGILLADLARHLGVAYQESGRDRLDTIRRIREGFDAEMESATDEPTGRVDA
jgi:hypothetical protein